MIGRGEIWWAELPPPTGSGPGKRRPVVIVSADSFNLSRIGTIVALDKRQLGERVGALDHDTLSRIDAGIRLVLDLVA